MSMQILVCSVPALVITIPNETADELVLTLSLSVQDLQQFHLQFQSRGQIEQWKRALLDLDAPDVPRQSPEVRSGQLRHR